MDLLIFQWVNQFAGKFSWLDDLAIFFGNNYFAYILILVLFILVIKNYQKYWITVIQALMAGILARFGIVEIIRLLWERPRPFIENNINLLFTHGPEGSFPSGHTAFYIAIASVLYSSNRKLGIVFFIGGFLIGIARVFSGIHWPSDILAGALVGIFSGWILIKLSEKLTKQKLPKKEV